MTDQLQEEVLDVISRSSTQTQRLGKRLGELLGGGELLLLDGQLGAGKTTFTQGLAQGMGINEVINSPTDLSPHLALLIRNWGQPCAKDMRGDSPSITLIYIVWMSLRKFLILVLMTTFLAPGCVSSNGLIRLARFGLPTGYTSV